jgi:hypothetical protein
MFFSYFRCLMPTKTIPYIVALAGIFMFRFTVLVYKI